jgi:hypothetical protein
MLVFSIVLVVAAILLPVFYLSAGAVERGLESPSWLDRFIPLATLFLTAIGTFAAVFFGWRGDRRQARELELKVKELEIKLQEAGRG